MLFSKSKKGRIHNNLPVAKEGLPFIITGCALTIFLFSIQYRTLGLLIGIFSLFTIYFFRDPDREPEYTEKTLLTPADGRIIKIQHLDHEKNPLGEPAIKVSVFMSLFSVHVNRVPISGRVSHIDYHPGKFFSANLDKASEENENNRITLETESGQKIVFIQIAGLIARRIVCWINKGDNVKSGQRCGLIRFGSRMDVYIPRESSIVAKENDRVKAGETIIGYMK